eukprot:4471169-Prymnesium_polylepis.1
MLSWGDYDGDNDLDLVESNFLGANTLFRNDFGTLVRVDSPAIDSANHRTSSMMWADIDNDGDLDLVVANDGFANQLIVFEHCPTSARAAHQSSACVTCPSNSYRAANFDACYECPILQLEHVPIFHVPQLFARHSKQKRRPVP